MNFQDLQGLSPEQIKNAAAYMMLQSYAPIFSTFVVIFISYIMRSYALSRITSKLHFEHTKLAWLPFAHAYVEGYICDYFVSPKLDKSNMRIHYPMLNIIQFTVNMGYMLYEAIWTTNILMPVFETGEISLEALQPDSNTGILVLGIANIILTLIVSYFKMKTLFFLHLSFDKKNGMIWIGLSLIINFINPILLLILSQKEPVYTSIESFPIRKKDN